MSNAVNPRLPGVDRQTPAATDGKDAEAKARIRAVASRITQFFGENEASIARMLNTVTATVKAYTDGNRLPATEMCIRMHEASGVSLNWLLLGKGPELLTGGFTSQIFSEEELKSIGELAKSRKTTTQDMIRRLALAQLEALDRLND